MLLSRRPDESKLLLCPASLKFNLTYPFHSRTTPTLINLDPGKNQLFFPIDFSLKVNLLETESIRGIMFLEGKQLVVLHASVDSSMFSHY